MTYADSVRHLYALGNELKIGAKWTLDRMQVLMARLGHPERLDCLVHVAGTNGKGSTAAMIAAALRASGRRVGLFTSPHLISPTERIQIDGDPISETRFAQAFEAVHHAALALQAEGAIDAHPSYFETVTAMAFWLFAGRDGQPPCQTSVIEVGLGGRLDATNVVTPQVSVITPVSFDHESFLGNTIESIAAEKAGIIKPDVPVVVSRQNPAPRAVIASRAESLRAPIVDAATLPVTNASFLPFGCRFVLDGLEYGCPLPGRHQFQNAITAIAACRLLQLPPTAVQLGLASAKWPGRLEYMRRSPDFILDGAHNPAGAAALASYVREFLTNRPVWIVYGTMRDKAIDEVVDLIFPLADRLILTAPDFPRALRPEAIVELAGQNEATIAPNVPSAIAAAEKAPPDTAVIFTGSLFLVGEVRAHLLAARDPS